MRLPRVHNEFLFRQLARLSGASLVCDVGAFDGAHSKRFRAAGLPVVAFEANPHCFAALAADRSIADSGIRLVHAAAWNKEEPVRFHVVTAAAKWHGSPRTSIGSVLERVPGYGLSTYDAVVVPGVRLDGVLAAEDGPVALWVDVEGAAYEVLEGMRGIRERVSVINVEVEMRAFWQGQRLGSDVVGALRELGFTPIARGPGGELQFDVVFVADRWLREAKLTVYASVTAAWCRGRASAVNGRLRRLRRSAGAA